MYRFKLSQILSRLVNGPISNATCLRRSLVTSSSLIECNHPDLEKIFKRDLILKEDFISPNEEQTLLNEIEPYMKKLRYEFDHWDDAIHGYRETERLNWNKDNSLILDRIKSFAFQNKFSPSANSADLLAHVHILDLSETGYIKAHVDSVRFCGSTIAGLSLLSDSVMKFTLEKDKTKHALALLKRRSLYIIKDDVRYDFAHEILKNEQSFFNGNRVPKTRRISVICRNKPIER